MLYNSILPLFFFVLPYACTTETFLSVSPDNLDFGEVNFREEMPEGGYHPLELTIQNTSTKDVDLYLQDADLTHLCVEGFTNIPTNVSKLSPNDRFVFLVSVCDYIEENGERDDLLTGAILLDDGTSTYEVPWSFTPVLDIAGDTGM